ncbi:unnamed protein product [Moneuplotes crassus]|uniref:Uncharacterized protein n=1 Tax=Euplotes crassus TaxID=5936 RepID=A0AAD2D2S5_EUPCR|nr:unnamed protein product [Moneuplotes crassus]
MVIENFVASFNSRSLSSISYLSHDELLSFIHDNSISRENFIRKAKCLCKYDKLLERNFKCRCKELNNHYILYNKVLILQSEKFDNEDPEFETKNAKLINTELRECSKDLESIIRGLEVLLEPEVDFFNVSSVLQLCM